MDWLIFLASTNAKTPLTHTASPHSPFVFPLPGTRTHIEPPPHHFSFEPPPISLDPRLSQRTNEPKNNDFAFDYDPETHKELETKPARLATEHSFASSNNSLINGNFDEDDTPSMEKAESTHWPGNSSQVPSVMLRDRGSHAPHQVALDDQTIMPTMTHVNQGLPSPDSLRSYEEEEIEEIIRETDPATFWLLPTTSPSPSDSSGSSAGAWTDTFAADIYAQPKMPYDSQETLMLRFDKQTCGILSVKDGPSENPWRTMLWPLAKGQGALWHAITSMTAFHASKDSPGLRVKGIKHMNQSIQLLASGMDSMPLTASLATTLVLAFCESWDILISTGIRHLQGASHLIGKMMTRYRRQKSLLRHEPCLGFLCRTWVYMDVIARLTSLEGDDSTNFDIVGTSLCQSSVSHQMDPLMGCASTLFPTIGRVANLVRKIRQRTQPNSLQIISQAKELKSSLDRWSPPSMVAAPEDRWTEVEQGFWTAEAYRGATLLYLLQAVPEISYGSVAETVRALANEVLRHIANVPVTSGMVIIHIFPLLAAGCEAVGIEDRMFVVDRWEAMMRRMKIQNLDRCLDVVKEVWERRDSAAFDMGRQDPHGADSIPQEGSMPTPSTATKRKYNSDEEDSPAEKKRRVIHNMFSPALSNSTPQFLKRESTNPSSDLEFDLTVRGRLHWAGVMNDFGWEGEFELSSLVNLS